MFQYYIVEIQKAHTGEYAHLIHYEYDADADRARQKAEGRFHAVLSAAAVSDTAMHSATLISAEGVPLRNECYHHDEVPAVESAANEEE